MQVNFAAPLTVNSRWLLLPGIPGGPRVHHRPDRLGCLRLSARLLAVQAFAFVPTSTTRLYFELVPAGPFFALLPVELPAPA